MAGHNTDKNGDGLEVEVSPRAVVPLSASEIGQLAQLLSTNPDFVALIRGGLRVMQAPTDVIPLPPGTVKTLYEQNSDTNAFTDADKTKLDGLTNSGPMSAAAIKTAYESNANTNAFTDTDLAKLATLFNTVVAGGTDIEVTGAGSAQDPFLITFTGSSGSSSFVIIEDSSIPPAGDEGRLYYFADVGGLYRWIDDPGEYEALNLGAAGGGGTTKVTRTADGIVSVIRYEGATAPTLALSSQGNYRIVEPAGTVIASVKITAATGAGATDGSNNFAVIIESADGNEHFGIDGAIDSDSGTRIGPKNDFGIAFNQSLAGAGQVQYSYTNIGGFANGFKILIKPCG